MTSMLISSVIAPMASLGFCLLCSAQGVPEPVPITSRAVATLSVPGFVDFLATDGEGVWATNKGRVEEFRHDVPTPISTVTVPSPCGAMVAAYGSLWVANCLDASVHRIDLQTKQVIATIPTGLADPRGELSLAAGADAIWVLTDRNGTLSRIDSKTNRITVHVQVAPNSFAAAFGFGSVWITNTLGTDGSTAGSVQRIDPANNTVTATIPVGPEPRFLAVGEGGVWTLNQGDGTVSRIDPKTNQPIAVIDTGMKGLGGDIATGAGRVWVRGKKILLAEIDPAVNRVVRVFGPPSGSGAVRVAGKHVWVTAHDVKTVWVIQAAE
jgi:virginiamycin B lyase